MLDKVQDPVAVAVGRKPRFDRVPRCLADAVAQCRLVRQTLDRVGERGSVAGLDDKAVPALFDKLAAADVVVCRAGGSLFEVAAAARPAIVVPWPDAAGDHQARNAGAFAATGAIVAVAEPQFDAARLQAEVEGLLAAPARREALAAAIRAMARPDAASAIADTVLQLAGSRA